MGRRRWHPARPPLLAWWGRGWGTSSPRATVPEDQGEAAWPLSLRNPRAAFPLDPTGEGVVSSPSSRGGDTDLTFQREECQGMRDLVCGQARCQGWGTLLLRGWHGRGRGWHGWGRGRPAVKGADCRPGVPGPSWELAAPG